MSLDYDASVVLTNKSLKEANQSERAALKKKISKLKAMLHTAEQVLKVHSRAFHNAELQVEKSLGVCLALHGDISDLKESMRSIQC